MAPCSSDSSRISQKDIKLKKPVMEKLCRDRINSCIEELSVIIGKEFHKEERKLVKADILEMTVNFLRQQLQAGVCQGDYSQGYSHCWRDSMRFLSSSEASVPPLQGLQRQDQKLQQVQRGSSSILRPTTLQDNSSRGPVWRPWWRPEGSCFLSQLLFHSMSLQCFITLMRIYVSVVLTS